MHEGLVIATNRVETGVIAAERDTDDVLRVATVGSGLATLSARIAEEADETVVIAGGQELTISGASNAVDVGAIGARGVDALSLPLELACLASPCGASGVGSAAWVLIAVRDGVEEELVGTAVRADVAGFGAPVEGHDVRVVGTALSGEGEVLVHVVDVDVVVVGADSKILVVRGEGHNLDPFSGVLKELDLIVGSGDIPDGDSTVIATNNEELVVDSNGASAL